MTRKIGVNSLFWKLYFLMVALPLHASNKILTYLSVTGKVSIFHIVLFLMLIWIFSDKISKNGFVIYRRNIILGLFSLSMIATFFVGMRDAHHIFNNVIGDGIMYFLSIAIVWIVRSDSFEDVAVDWFLTYTFKALTVNLVINVIMYATQGLSFWGLQSYNGGRFGGGYLSLLVVTVIYGVHDYLYKKSIPTKWLILHIVLAVFCSVLSQSRTHVILSFVGCLMLFIPMGKSISKAYFFRILIITLVGTVGIVALLNGNSELVQRILNMDVTSDTETTASRIITWTYYWRLIKKTPWGTGFGEILYFINPSMTIAKATATYYVDNAVAVVLYKCGWIGGALYLGYVLVTPIRMLSVWKSTHKKEFLLFAVIFLMLILSIMILTSQVIHTYAVNVFIWTTIALTYKWSKTEESK